MTKKCLNCDNTFEQPEGKREKKFCSDGCRAAYNQRVETSFEKDLEKILEKYKDEKKLLLGDMMAVGFSVFQTTELGMRRIDPLSDEAKEVMFGVAIMEMTKQELKKRFGVILPEKKESPDAPKNLLELKNLCPPELTGFAKSDWIAKKRVEYGI